MKKQTYIFENKPKGVNATPEMVKLLVPQSRDITHTSQLLNDGQDGIFPYATTEDLDIKADKTDLDAYIPLAGNALQNPVTGEIYFQFSGQSLSKLGLTDHGFGFTNGANYVTPQALYHKIADGNRVSIGTSADAVNVAAGLANPEFKGLRGNRYFGAKYDTLSYTQKQYVDEKDAALETKLSGFTTQEILTGGNYNNLEVTADLLVFKNENAQAILNGVWGKKDFHILNLSSTYEVKINHNSASVIGNGQPIKLPTATGNMGIKGTARILQTAGYGYFVADTWGSRYRPEFKGLSEKKVVTVNENSEAEVMDLVEFIVFRDAQSTPMTKAELNLAFPDAKRPFQVICTGLNLIYMKTDNNTNSWKSIPLTNVT